MDVAKTPMGTQIVLKAEKPGMVIGKGGKNIRKITTTLEDRFNMDDPQIDVQEVDEPDLNAAIVADRLANALGARLVLPEGRSHDDRPDHGVRRAGAEIVLWGKSPARAHAWRSSTVATSSTTVNPPRPSSTPPSGHRGDEAGHHRCSR